MHDKNSRLPGEGLFAILMAAISVVAVWKAYGIAGFEALSSPGAFPLAVSTVMLVAAAIILRHTLSLPKSTIVTSFATVMPWRVLFMIGMVILYALAVQPLGFLPTSFLFVFVSMQVLGGGNVVRNLGYTALSLAVIYAIFRLVFAVLMPEGIVPEREIIAWVRTLFAGGAE